jgi:hypothetical protein
MTPHPVGIPLTPTLWPQATPSPVPGGEGENHLSSLGDGVNSLSYLGERTNPLSRLGGMGWPGARGPGA